MPKKSEKENIIVYLLENASDKIMLIESMGKQKKIKIKIMPHIFY